MMNTFSQIYLQFVLIVEDRENYIPFEHKNELHLFIAKLVQHRKSKLLAINCMPDHLHMFVSFRPVVTINDFMNKIKRESSDLINGKRWVKRKFSWADGYGCFSYSQSHIERVIRYISNQEKHHQLRDFRDEYWDFINKYEISLQRQDFLQLLSPKSTTP